MLILEDGNADIPGIVTETNHTFVPGCFACNVVWETKFILHPRLKMNPVKSGLSRGIQALCSALGGFSVTNRKNLFVYEDVDKQVFYLRYRRAGTRNRNGFHVALSCFMCVCVKIVRIDAWVSEVARERGNFFGLVFAKLFVHLIEQETV